MSFIKNFFTVSGDKNKEFWFSHFLVILATVCGVYLAASAGLRTAVEFELIKSDRDSYYMRSALYDELSDNLDNIEAWSNEYVSGNARKFIGKPDDFTLDTYVWKTMQDATGTFEIPSKILTDIRRYYRNTEVGLAKMTSKKPAAHVVEKMISSSKALRDGSLIGLQSDISQLKKKLEKLDIAL